MIDQMSRALPEMTWLTRVQQDRLHVTIEGRCLSLTSLSDFIGNLEASRYFKRPVEILSSAVVSGTTAVPDTIRSRSGVVPDGRHRADRSTPPAGPGPRRRPRGGRRG